ncbi:MAG: triose-phosphate isomerase [Bacilli bacterium]|nr:triose-phosphate isomerase [Bacilli bacterium]
MKKIFLNLKRFDIPKTLGGINDSFNPRRWGKVIARQLEEFAFENKDIEIVVFFPEGHLLKASHQSKYLTIGCQGVFWKDVEAKGNFGAFTTFQTAKSAKSLGATWAVIGHSEERNNLREVISLGGGNNFNAINEIVNKEVKCAINAGMKVLFCVGETAIEQSSKYTVLTNQIKQGLAGVDLEQIIIAYEPVWAIGPGKNPPNAEYITDIVKFIKKICNVPVVYGGGLKEENASMLSGIKELDGGLIALTRFGDDFGFSVDGFIKIVNAYKGVSE